MARPSLLLFIAVSYCFGGLCTTLATAHPAGRNIRVWQVGKRVRYR